MDSKNEKIMNVEKLNTIFWSNISNKLFDF